MFSRACRVHNIDARLSLSQRQRGEKLVSRLPYAQVTQVTCFPALVTGYMFSRPFQWKHILPRLPVPVTCPPTPSASNVFSGAWHLLQLLPQLAPLTCFLVFFAFITGYLTALPAAYTFSRACCNQTYACFQFHHLNTASQMTSIQVLIGESHQLLDYLWPWFLFWTSLPHSVLSGF